MRNEVLTSSPHVLRCYFLVFFVGTTTSPFMRTRLVTYGRGPNICLSSNHSNSIFQNHRSFTRVNIDSFSYGISVAETSDGLMSLGIPESDSAAFLLRAIAFFAEIGGLSVSIFHSGVAL